jgi:hypothetical protein
MLKMASLTLSGVGRMPLSGKVTRLFPLAEPLMIRTENHLVTTTQVDSQQPKILGEFITEGEKRQGFPGERTFQVSGCAFRVKRLECAVEKISALF